MKEMKQQGIKLLSVGLCIASIGISVYCVYSYLHLASFVMPAADDFMISAGIKESRLLGEGYFLLALKGMREIYLTWQGTYVSNFLLYYIAPYVRMGVDGIRVFCMVSIILFYGSLWSLIYCIMKKLLGCRQNTAVILVCAMSTWLVSNARVMMENFFWYNGACVYTLPLIFVLLGIRHLVRYAFVKESKRDLIGAIVFGFLACGGVLQCSAIVCFVYLLICVWGFWTKYNGRKGLGAAFLIAFISALANCLAPGNFTRQGAINESGLPIFKAFGWSLANVLRESWRLLTETDMLYILTIMLLAGFLMWHCNEQMLKIGMLTIILSGLGVLLCVWVSCYPVALGYSSTLMEPRGYFIIDVFLIAGFMLVMFMTGGFIGQRAGKYIVKEKKIFGIMTVFAVAVFFILNAVIPVKELSRPISVCVEDDKFGYLVRFRDMWGEILEQIEHSDEENVTVQSKLIPSPQELKNPDLSSDPEYWINVGAARYFGKETVRIEWIE
ncbi:MAG: hypothetical protein K2L82_01305 [Lachnospiraceae bacterium]|nr:hypothetical protein [Lachnospiraceae bacterium]